MLHVIFATVNGGDYLARMLDAVEKLETPSCGFRICAVDNGSASHTREILEKAKKRLPLTVLSHPVPGKNHALNAALDHIAEDMEPDDLCVFTDDDVLPAPDWLTAFEKAATEYGQTTIFAGPITPFFPETISPHVSALTPFYDILFAQTDGPDGPCACDRAWGPNMAIRAGIFRSGIRFNATFGPNRSTMFPMGSETELTKRLESTGHSARYVNKARVRHQIKPEMLELEYVRQRAVRHGFGEGLIRQQEGRTSRLALTVQALRGLLSSSLRRPFSPAGERARLDFQFHWAGGLARSVLTPSASAEGSDRHLSCNDPPRGAPRSAEARQREGVST